MILLSLLVSSPLAAASLTPELPARPTEHTVQGDRLDPSDVGPSWVETMETVIRRERENPAPPTIRFVPEPESPFEEQVKKEKELAARESGGGSGQEQLGGGGTTAVVGTNFVGPAIGSPGGGWIPPDTCGAIGPIHFVSVVNANISVWNRTTGARLVNVGQPAFWATGSSLGDGRATYDPHSGRFILLSEDFSSRIFLAVSATSDPTGAWFKTSFAVDTGTDTGTWPDYPTLGVDANGIYTAMYQVGGADTMSIFAINKAPLVNNPQSMGTVTAFRQRPWEGAIHPCVTYGTPGVEYLVSRPGSGQQRLVRVNPPLTAPTLTDLGTYGVQSNGVPPNASQSGGGSLDTLDGRLMNAVYRNGFVWTANCMALSGRAACQWYQINPSGPSQAQWGRVDDPTLHYFFPGIAVNAAGDMVLGFSGSSSSQFPGTYVTGRLSSDPAGQTGPPVLLKAGESANNDGRYGDYSLTSVDPTNDLDFWTIQEYGRGGSWGTWIGQVSMSGCAVVAPTSFCVTSPNTVGPGATMSSFGSTSISANDLVLETFALPPNKVCIYFYGMDQSAFNPFGNGIRCIANPFFRLPLTTSNDFGDAQHVLDLTDLPVNGDIQAGESWGFQCWYRDPQAPGATTNVSDGLTTNWCP